MRGLPPVKFDFMSFEGGLDLVTPPLRTTAGSCINAQNFEIGISGGYDRIEGYERFDGQAKPSDATYAIINVTITGSISVGDTVTGATSSATALVVAVVSGYLVVTKTSGDFETAGETLNVGGSPQATSSTAALVGGASSSLLNAQYLNLAADEYRSDIAAVPGTGSILGIWSLNDVKYAFRANAGNTAVDLYKSSSSGWTQVPLGFELSFTSGGTTEIVEGNTITGGTSGATAVLTRVVLESGTWAGGDAAGRFIFASQTGTFQAEAIDVGASPNLATIAGDSSAITLSTGGRFEFINHNFGGAAGAERAYGVDGANRGFEFDGTVFVPIDTGMTTDTPLHVGAHKNHLFFSFSGSAQHSSIGGPYQWSPVTGAGELAVGDTITAFKREPGVQGGATFGIYSRQSVHMLYGNDSSDWNLVPYRDELGAFAYTVEQLAYSLMLDDRGVANLQTAQEYGNFRHATLSNKIQPWIVERRSKVLASCIVRDKNQYRLFFSDNYALYTTFEGNKVRGMMPILLDHKVECMFSLENSSGVEEIFFGSDDGFVYQMEKGTSFDGAAIEFFLFTHPWHSGSPRVNKRYRGCTLEARGDGYTQFNFSYELGYNSTNLAQSGLETKTTNFSSVNWDSFTWDSFIWDGVTLAVSECEMDGTAENVAIVINGESDYYFPISITGALLRYSPRRQLR